MDVTAGKAGHSAVGYFEPRSAGASQGRSRGLVRSSSCGKLLTLGVGGRIEVGRR
jgi:hypothetical protein